MAETIASHLHALDPISLLLSQNSSPSNPIPLRLTTESYYTMERGPRYRAYAELRETRLRMKSGKHQESEETEFKQTPTKKQVKFSSSLGVGVGGSRKGYSVLAQSVPDFSATLRKENRKPVTPPPPASKSNWSKGGNGVSPSLSNSRGSKSANAGEKKGGGGGRLMMAAARKSYACVEELKGISMAAANAINGESRKNSGRGVLANNKTVLGYRQF